MKFYFTARSKLVKFCFSAACDFLFVHQISREPLNGFTPNSHGRRVWSVARTSLNVKVKGQGHQGQQTRCALPSPPAATEWNALAANNVMQQQSEPLRRCREVISAGCVRFMFGKTSLALVYCLIVKTVQTSCRLSSIYAARRDETVGVGGVN